MPVMNINAIFEELAATPGKNDKLAILNRHKDNNLFKEVCRLALDPFTLFYTTKIPVYPVQPFGVRLDLRQAVSRLSNITDRIVTGNAAREYLAVLLSDLSEDDAKVIERIILKDLRCGVDTAVNKVWKGLVPEFPYMRCSLTKEVKISEWDWESGIIAQLKADGMFLNVNFKDGEVTFLSRNGSPFPMEDFSELVADIKANITPETQTHGEMLVEIDGVIASRKVGNGILNKVLKGKNTFAKNERPVIMVWDQIPQIAVVPGGKYRVKYADRFASLQSQVSKSKCLNLIETLTVHDETEAMEFYGNCIRKGLEGAVVKRPDAIWEDTTSRGQVKLKNVLDCDLEVIEWVEGKGKYVGQMGKLICASSDRKVIVGVGSGWSDTERATIGKEVIGKIVAVQYNERITDKSRPENDSLFLPRVLEIREDKTTADPSSKIK